MLHTGKGNNDTHPQYTLDGSKTEGDATRRRVYVRRTHRSRDGLPKREDDCAGARGTGYLAYLQAVGIRPERIVAPTLPLNPKAVRERRRSA